MRLPTLLAVALLLPLAACADQRADTPGASASASAPAPLPLIDRAWTITTIDGAPIAAAEGAPAPTLRFANDTVSGSGGVNRLSGSAKIGEGRVTIGPLLSTRMAGPPALMAQEDAIIRALDAVRTWSIVGGDLLLQDVDGVARIRAR